MFPRRTLVVLNFSLALIGLVLLLALLGVRLPSVGKVLDVFNKEEPQCFVEWNGKATAWPDLERCCLEARKQLSCDFEGRLWVCSTSSSRKGVHYLLNTKAYHYCQQQVIWK